MSAIEISFPQLDLIISRLELLEQAVKDLSKGKAEVTEGVSAEPVPEKPKKARKSRAKPKAEAPVPADPPAVEGEVIPANGGAAPELPTDAELITRLKAYASKNGATGVKTALADLGVDRLSQLDDAGKQSLITNLNL